MSCIRLLRWSLDYGLMLLDITGICLDICSCERWNGCLIISVLILLIFMCNFSRVTFVPLWLFNLDKIWIRIFWPRLVIR